MYPAQTYSVSAFTTDSDFWTYDQIEYEITATSASDELAADEYDWISINGVVFSSYTTDVAASLEFEFFRADNLKDTTVTITIKGII